MKQCGSNSHADSPLDPNTVFTGTILCFLRDSNVDADHFEGLYPGQATQKEGWNEVRSLAQMQADPWDVLTAIAIGLKPNRSASRPVAYPGYLEPDASPATLLDEEREHVTRQAAQEDARKKRLVAERFATQPEQPHPPASMAPTFRAASLREDRQPLHGAFEGTLGSVYTLRTSTQGSGGFEASNSPLIRSTVTQLVTARLRVYS